MSKLYTLEDFTVIDLSQIVQIMRTENGSYFVYFRNDDKPMGIKDTTESTDKKVWGLRSQLVAAWHLYHGQVGEGIQVSYALIQGLEFQKGKLLISFKVNFDGKEELFVRPIGEVLDFSQVSALRHMMRTSDKQLDLVCLFDGFERNRNLVKFRLSL